MKVIAFLLLLAVSWFVSGWLIMLGVGVAHGEWLPNLPTIGYSSGLAFSAFFVLYAAITQVLRALAEVLVES